VRLICDLEITALPSMHAKLTRRLIESNEVLATAKTKNGAVIIHDSELRGFQCKVSPNGKRTYLLYYRTAYGRERRPAIGTHGRITCEQARDIATIWLAEVTRGGDPSRDRQLARAAPTIADLAQRYMRDHAIPNKKPSSVESDKALLRLYILPRFAKIKVGDLTRADVYRLRTGLAHRPGAANRALALLSKMMNLAEKWELRIDGSNPVRHVERFKERKIERFLSIEEFTRLGQALAETEQLSLEFLTVAPAIRLLLLTGCRLGEILTLRWESVDFDEGCLRLAESKTGPKVVHLPVTALAILRDLKQRSSQPFVIFGRQAGTHLIGIQRPWQRIRARAKLEDVRLHDLRHTFASVAVSSGLSLPIIGRMLGHTQPQTTARYAHLYTAPLKHAVESVGTALAAALLSKSLVSHASTDTTDA